MEVGGRALRLDFAEMDPMANDQGRPRPPPALAPFPAGAPLPAGVAATDAITHTIASLPPHQLMDILTQMKGLAGTAPDQARALLQGNPQLAYAVFHAMLMMNVVDPAVVQRVLGEGNAGAALPAPPAPQPRMREPRATSTPTPAAPRLDGQQQQLLQQVLQLSPEQIQALPPDQRASILQLKAQFGH